MELLSPLAELAIAVVALILQLAVYLLAAIFSFGIMAGRKRGVRRGIFVVGALAAAFLLLALLHLFGPFGTSTWLLVWINKASVGAAALVLFLAAVAGVALEQLDESGQRRPRPDKAARDRSELHNAAFFFSAVIVIGGFMIWAEAARGPSLEEKACAEMRERIPEGWRSLADLAAEVTDERLEFDIPRFCQPD